MITCGMATQWLLMQIRVMQCGELDKDGQKQSMPECVLNIFELYRCLEGSSKRLPYTVIYADLQRCKVESALFKSPHTLTPLRMANYSLLVLPYSRSLLTQLNYASSAGQHHLIDHVILHLAGSVLMPSEPSRLLMQFKFQ